MIETVPGIVISDKLLPENDQSPISLSYSGKLIIDNSLLLNTISPIISNLLLNSKFLSRFELKARLPILFKLSGSSIWDK